MARDFKKTFKKKGTWFILTLLLFSCSSNPLHLNHAAYKVKPGETIEIYTSTNSCCYYCGPDNQTFRAIRFEKQEVVEKEPRECNGCSHTDAWTFKALRPGTDTIIMRKMPGGQACTDSTATTERYIVKVDEP
jgi:hypothetical protein